MAGTLAVMHDRVSRALDRVPPWLLSVLALLAFAGVATWLSVTTWNQLSTSRLDQGMLTDFRDAVYYPVVAIRDGVNPYSASTYYEHYPVGQEFPLYTPHHLLLHSPLLLFPFATARAVYFGWNVALILGFAAATLRLLGIRTSMAGVFGLGTLILLSDPGRFDLRTGQPTLMIVIAVYFAIRARNHRGAAADLRALPSRAVSMLLGAAALAVIWTKPTYAIPVGVLLIARGRTRLVAYGTAIGFALSALVLPFLVGAAGGVNSLVDSWTESARITSRSPQSQLGSGLRIDLANTFARITRLRPSEAVAAIGGLLLLAAGAFLIRKLHQRDPDGDREELAITLFCLLVLTSMFHVPYDYLLLVGPVALLARPRPSRPIAWPYRARTAVMVLLLVPLIGPLGWSPINAAIGKSGFEWMLKTTMMSTYVLIALGLCVWTAIRQLRASRPNRAVSAGQVGGVVEAEQAGHSVGRTDPGD